MTGRHVRGACPSLSAPMETGDGLLARLTPRDGALSSAQLAGVADAAARCGNGLIEVTARGSLQIRGLTAASAVDLAEAINRLGIEPAGGIDIRTGPLAGLDPSETADARPLAAALRAAVAAEGLFARLAPKMSVTVDGGGALGLGELLADVRLEALGADDWLVSVGGTAADARPLGRAGAAQAAQAALRVLRALAARGSKARGRDLDAAALAALRGDLGIAPHRSGHAPASLPVGRFVHRDGIALGLALPFGQVHADGVIALAGPAGADQPFRLAPGRGLLALARGEDAAARLAAVAERLGFVTRAEDPRLAVVACAGAPACASAFLPTKAIARDLAAAGSLPAGTRLHVSGCAKQCARPAGPSTSLVGGPAGYEIKADGREPDPRVADLLHRAARSHGGHPLKATA